MKIKFFIFSLTVFSLDNNMKKINVTQEEYARD